jgi:hypothetical protein
MITCEIKMGSDYVTRCSGETIQEVLQEILDYHLLTDFEIKHYQKLDRLEKELATGWYIVEEE